MEQKQRQVWKARAIVLLWLLIGATLRLYDIGQSPPGLYHDEAQHGLDALYVLEGNVPLYFPANNGREPLFIYLVTASVGLLGRSPLAVRLPSFFVGFLTLAATYDLARVLWGQRAGRWALAVLAVTFWHVHLSRVGFRAILLPLFSALYLAQAARGLRTKRTRHWVAAGALYGASWYTYMAARFTPVALAVMILYAMITHRDAVRGAWRGTLAFCAAALIILLPLGLYTVQHPDIVLSRTGQVTITHPEINHGDFWGTLAYHTLRTAEMFFVRGDRIWRHNLAWRPVWDSALGLAFAIGLGAALSLSRRNGGAALTLLWTATMSLPTLLAEDAPHFLRGVGVLPTAVLLPALGLMWIESKVKSQKSKVKTAPDEGYISRFAFYVSRFTFHFSRLLPSFLIMFGLSVTTYDYFVRFANAEQTYHWFEAGPVALAGNINTLRNTGWDGDQMLHGPEKGRTVYVERQLWDSWSAVPFLTPQDEIRFLPMTEAPILNGGLAFFVWPYRDWEQDILPYLPHPAYLSVTQGPQAQGDKDPTPFTVAMQIQAETRPEVPDPIARFAGGIILRAALVRASESGAYVRLWWECEAAPDAAYTVFVHYLRDGQIIAQHDRQPGYGHLPTSFWQPGDLILDEHLLPGLVPDPARDRLRVGLYHSETMEGMAALNDAGQPVGDWIEWGVILTP